MMEYTYAYDSPLGRLYLTASEDALSGLSFTKPQAGSFVPALPIHNAACRQLSEYFEGRRKVFDVPLSPAGTPFQKAVWNALLAIPYGKTSTYQEIARTVGNPNACRAVGMANHHNPIAIFIPCHRVIGKSGSLTGYAGGLSIKEKLLQLEGVPIGSGGTIA